MVLDQPSEGVHRQELPVKVEEYLGHFSRFPTPGQISAAEVAGGLLLVPEGARWISRMPAWSVPFLQRIFPS